MHFRSYEQKCPNSDDGVADTPIQADYNFGCPTLGNTPGCSEEALFMNFMDYAEDACMFMFTAGQIKRAEAWVNSGLYNNLKKNVLGAATATENETVDNNTSEEDQTADTETTDAPDEDSTEEGTGAAIAIKVTLDDFGSETTFMIVDDEGNTVEEYGPFQNGQEGKVISKYMILPDGYYTFIIDDSYGDGICCDTGEGKWKLFKDATVIKSSNGRFGYYEEYDFTVGYARISKPTSRKDAQLKSKIIQE